MPACGQMCYIQLWTLRRLQLNAPDYNESESDFRPANGEALFDSAPAPDIPLAYLI